jgi:hypothetical protein
MTILILSIFSRHYLCNRATILDYIDGNSPKQYSPEVRMILSETSCVFTERMWKVRTAKKILVGPLDLKTILPERRCGSKDITDVGFKKTGCDYMGSTKFIYWWQFVNTAINIEVP